MKPILYASALWLGLACLATPLRADNSPDVFWPQFRGPSGNGISAAAGVPLHWTEEENVAWKTPIPGKGWSSPVVADGVVWMTTATERAPTEEEKAELLSQVETKQQKARQVAATVQFQAVAVDLASGEVLKTVQLLEFSHPDPIHTLNSYASPTPVLEDGFLYCHFGTYGTACLDTRTDQVVWEKRFPLVHNVGPGSSPFIAGDLLILICDGVDDQYVLALDKKTGETAWKTARPPYRAEDGDRRKAYCTPILIEHEGQPQLICSGSQWIVAYDPATGEEIWKFDHGDGFSTVPRPVYGHGMIYFITGFPQAELFALRPGTASKEPEVVWTETKRIPTKPSPQLAGDLLVIISDGGIAAALDARTGEEQWTERIEGNYSASPILVEDRIYFSSQEGLTTVIAAGPEFKVLAENEIDGQIMASLIPLPGQLLLRSDTALYKIAE